MEGGIKKLSEALKSLGIEPSHEMMEKFELYMERVLEWNERVNLTAIRDRDAFVEKHFIDSVCCVSDSRWSEAASVIDVGTGAGFPGLPLAIVSPEKEFLLIDSSRKGGRAGASEKVQRKIRCLRFQGCLPSLRSGGILPAVYP